MVDIAVDAEKLVVDWCLTVDEITAIYGDRIYTEIPGSPVWPLLRIIRIGGRPTERTTSRLDNPLIQLDSYGGPKVTARLGSATVLAHMTASIVGSHDLGAVTSVEAGGPQWFPDDSYSPARPRYVASVRLWTHP